MELLPASEGPGFLGGLGTGESTDQLAIECLGTSLTLFIAELLEYTAREEHSPGDVLDLITVKDYHAQVVQGCRLEYLSCVLAPFLDVRCLLGRGNRPMPVCAAAMVNESALGSASTSS